MDIFLIVLSICFLVHTTLTYATDVVFACAWNENTRDRSHAYCINNIQDVIGLVTAGWYDVVECWCCPITKEEDSEILKSHDT